MGAGPVWLSRPRPTGPLSRANSRTPGDIGRERRGGPLSTKGPPVRGRDTFDSPSDSLLELGVADAGG